MARRRKDPAMVWMAEILDTDSATLATASQNVVAGLTQKSTDQEFKVRSGAYGGLRDIEAHYTKMLRKIERVDTGSSRKTDVMKALRAYTKALADYQVALKKPNDDAQVKALKDASKRAARAARALESARESL